jgi:hypothetical protein
MSDVRVFFDKDYLYSFHLDGKDCTVTIDRVVQGAIPGTDGKKTKKPLVYFRSQQKPLALNITNVRVIGGMYGFKAEDWVGKRITIYPTTTTFGPKTVDCIRVRPTIPPARNPEGGINENAAIPIEHEPVV